jgi:hypothetical protein
MPVASFYSLDLISTFFFCVQIFVRIKSTLNDQGSRISLSHAVFIATKISGKACRLSSRGGGGVQSVVFFGTASPIGSFFEARGCIRVSETLYFFIFCTFKITIISPCLLGLLTFLIFFGHFYAMCQKIYIYGVYP